MYNLLVTSKAGIWDGPAPTYHFRGERFLSHTPTHLRDRFLHLRPETIAELCSIPTLFAYESDIDRPANFGRITNVAQSTSSVSLTFRLDPTAPVLSRDELLDRQIELGIADPYELNFARHIGQSRTLTSQELPNPCSISAPCKRLRRSPMQPCEGSQ